MAFKKTKEKNRKETKINNLMNMDLQKKQSISSREIAEITGKTHANVLKAIRKMETAWKTVNGVNFDLVEYSDAKGEKRPEYLLNKTESLYVSTKFNDEARAKLVIRWERLETERIAEEKNPELAIDRAITSWKKKGKTDEWINKRIHAKAGRNAFTQTLKSHGVKGSGYRDCTNAIYIGFYGKEAKELRQQKNLISGCNIRENMTEVGLSAISLIESLAKEDIKKRNLRGNQQCSLSAHDAATGVRQMIKQFNNR